MMFELGHYVKYNSLETLKDDELQEMIDEADRDGDGDGEINQEEFLRIMSKTVTLSSHLVEFVLVLNIGKEVFLVIAIVSDENGSAISIYPVETGQTS
jgi:hypothetical protein